jgi:hypothetical protein
MECFPFLFLLSVFRFPHISFIYQRWNPVRLLREDWLKLLEVLQIRGPHEVRPPSVITSTEGDIATSVIKTHQREDETVGSRIHAILPSVTYPCQPHPPVVFPFSSFAMQLIDGVSVGFSRFPSHPQIHKSPFLGRPTNAGPNSTLQRFPFGQTNKMCAVAPGYP